VQKTGDVAENLVTHNERSGEDKDENEGAQVIGSLNFDSGVPRKKQGTPLYFID
jgi:hypothetical protein